VRLGPCLHMRIAVSMCGGPPRCQVLYGFSGSSQSSVEVVLAESHEPTQYIGRIHRSEAASVPSLWHARRLRCDGALRASLHASSLVKASARESHA
jgi:hypothetical protein